MLGALERSEVGEQLFFVARRDQQRDEDQIRDAFGDRRHGGIPRVDEHELRAHLFADHPLEHSRLAVVGLDGEYESH